ncbi:hypothetical protein [Nakamurella leprariae]|uniref:Uncharacterized protein n=1 Tax=Nakamurella leprariae TaxID=2803911 RepID=A0A938Y4E0_9ACTN|nr:hypothetical protein [Nakamurella leprariae]MBM9465856.1 hypothetical protein [Nakamurella leprariae]
MSLADRSQDPEHRVRGMRRRRSIVFGIGMIVALAPLITLPATTTASQRWWAVGVTALAALSWAAVQAMTGRGPIDQDAGRRLPGGALGAILGAVLVATLAPSAFPTPLWMAAIWIFVAAFAGSSLVTVVTIVLRRRLLARG